MNVAYLGPLRDYSGYGEANRHAVAALDAAGVNVIGKMVSYVSEISDFGELGDLITRLTEKDEEYRIKILHTTPDQIRRHKERGKYHIAHFFWETDKVPAQFADGLNQVDEIWTGSQANVDAIRKAGVEVPVFVFPQAIQTDREWPAPYELDNFHGYLFYSIFEWIDRKNPQALLRAYFEEFQNGEKVGLLLKTYFKNFALANKQMIHESVARLKAEYGAENSPPVFLYRDLMDRRHIMRLHKTGNCYVSAHRGEGWGVPQVEAMLAGNPVISTDYGGVHEYIENGKQGITLPFEMTRVRGMAHSSFWYTSDQNWAEVDITALRAALRYAYSEQESMAKIAANGQKLAMDRFNLKTVGDEMAARLVEIEAGL